MKEINNSKSVIRLPILLAIAIATGVLIGATMVNTSDGKKDLYQSIYKFREIVSYIDRNYVDEVDTDELVETAINDMLEKLDPHTSYIPAKDQELVSSQLEGKFEGIGIEFNIFHDTIYVVSPLSGGPSEKVGLKAGDKIVKVDGEVVAGIGITNRGVFDRLRGTKGSEVIVSIKRRNVDELMDFKIERDKIPQYSIDVAYMVDEEIGYLKINRFTATTYDEFKEALKKLNDQGMTKLMLDLTGNPGGYMDKAINIADEFLSGNKMIVYTKGKEARYNAEHRAYRKGQFEQGSLIVLIDAGSASASEILSGAIQDNDRGLIVGRRSFGKGLVQMPISLNDGSELRLTISRYYTPSGRSIQKHYELGEQDDYYRDFSTRINNGELYSADSMQVTDSLLFETLKGRTVYGGGGIMPDVFVSLDSTDNSAYLNKLFYTNTIREYALRYFEENKALLEKYEYSQFKDNFQVNEPMLDELIELGEANGAPFNEQQYMKSRPFIQTFLKAQIARGVWDNEGFFPIYNQTNEIFLEALKLFDEADAIAENGD
ncbi:MAG: S41 family peptidase [Cyclobacteriaceae bacterium]